MQKGPLRTLTGKVTYEGVLSELVSEKKHETQTMNHIEEDPYSVTMLSIIYSSLSPKTVKDLVPILGYRVLNQQKSYLEEKKLLKKSSTEDKCLLDLFFVLLEECPTTVSLYKLEESLLPPLVIKLLSLFLVIQERTDPDPK